MTEMSSPVIMKGETGTPENVPQSSDQPSSSNTTKQNSKPASSSPTAPAIPTFPPPKTDKPRPHVCTTCMRSFARLEHLKRHERSHTKEKPFECPSCTRCFARRDLLLRHQQKLHSTTTPSSRPRNSRRESTAGVAGGRVRKNSVISSTTSAMRPRANTLSHVESSSLGLMTSGAFARQFAPVHNHHNSFGGLTTNSGFGFRGVGTHSHPAAASLPRLETTGLSTDLSGGLRTAPPFGGFGAEFGISGSGFDLCHGNTINPHALHMSGMQGYPLDNAFESLHQMNSAMSAPQNAIDDDSFEWISHGFESQMAFAPGNENAIDDSPSVLSTNSPSGFHDNATSMSSANVVDNGANAMGSLWQPAMSNPPHVVNSPMSMDMSSFFGDIAQPTTETISPKSLMAQKAPHFDMNFPTPPDLTTIDPSALTTMPGAAFTLQFKHEHIASTSSSASVESSLRQSSVTTTTSSELVSDQMRNMLIAGLSQNTGFGQRKQSQPAISSPLSPGAYPKFQGFNPAMFPSTQDLQRYVSAYIRYFHPHLPFLHIATLNFESAEYSATERISNNHSQFPSNSTAGGSCLMLSVAALGALFENETIHSRDLFECGKRLISTYLEERRRQKVTRKSFVPYRQSEREDTPLWLVQAMLLNVIYGHNCGDKTAADIASNHCAALVSLARGAELAKPYPACSGVNGNIDVNQIQHMQNNGISPDGWNLSNVDANDSDWHEWRIMEERKRTLYAIFILSSLLVTAYNRAPALTNSEIRLGLPCEEELWAANSAHSWRALGGNALAESRSIQFATALTHLLTAAQRQRQTAQQVQSGELWMTEEFGLKPSSFGCLVLINALHNYIWETRQRHLGRQWTPHEIEAMHAHIEPALSAWQTAWKSNPTHAVERPNPFGAGPLSADSIPLLDLAYVRLFVDFGRSKEAYWQRDYDAMAQELARGSDSIAASGIQSSIGLQSPPSENHNPATEVDSDFHDKQTIIDSADQAGPRPTQRERHLRKAAFYAADHLIASDRLGVGLDEQNARELPMQSILCACDSAQVLAEWVASVQQRIGKYVGVLGRDNIDLTSVPSILLLDDEDRTLLSMIDDLLGAMESKQDMNDALIEAREGGYGSRILIVASQTMIKAAVWPVTKLMAHSLETQASHVKARALASMQTCST